jgi:hypothetical protein
MSQPRRPLASSLVAGFLVGAAVLGWADWRLESRWLEVRRRDSFGSLERAALDFAVRTPSDARTRRLFWLIDADNLGAALPLLENPELFASVFPGYGAARTDAALWDRYFTLPFDSRVFSSALSARSQPQVMTSWTGALALHAAYGADALLFGSSEVFTGLAPALLSRALATPASAEPKVLSLAVGNMSPEAVALAAGAAADTGRRARLAVWGYSLWNAYPSAHSESLRPDLMRSWNARNGRTLRERLREAAPVSWDDLMPLSLQLVWDAKHASTHGDVTFSLPASGDAATIERDAAALTPRVSEFEGITEAACGLDGAARELDAALAQLLRAADKVLLYVPPTTPLERASVPPCFEPAVRRLLESRAGARVAVRMEDWRSYGLSYRDYLKPSNRDGRAWIDPNHVNAGGTLKVSALVGRWAAEAARAR